MNQILRTPHEGPFTETASKKGQRRIWSSAGTLPITADSPRIFTGRLHRNPPEPHQVSAPETSGYMHQNPLEPHQVSAPLEPSRTVEPPQVSSQEPFTGTSGAIWTGTFETSPAVCTVTLWNLVRNLVLKRNQIACASRSRKMAWIFLTHFNLTNQSPRHAPQVGFQKHHSQRQKKCRRRSRLRTMKQCPNLPTSSNAHQRCSF